MSGYKDIIIVILFIYSSNCINDTNNVDVRKFKRYENVTSKTKGDLLDLCPIFKKDKFNIEEMADVWQTVVHTAEDNVPCFKIIIRKVGKSERKLYKVRFGSFGGNVFWDNCTLEIRSTGNKLFSRHHFLQQTSAHHGVFRNIIIEKGATSKLVQERADQWFVQKNLLTMRDCFNGDIIIFIRVPHQPNRTLIEDTLTAYRRKTGISTCDSIL